MDIREFFDLSLLEDVMTEWSKATGMATIAMDNKGKYLTREIGFTDFCMKYTRGTKEGLRRCTLSDVGNTGVYYCHAGLMDFSVDISLEDGTYLGKVIGGQILPKKPDLDYFRKLAGEMKIDPQKYLEALEKIEIRSEEAIQASAYLLGKIVNLLVNSEYTRKKQKEVIVKMGEENKLDPLTGIYNKSVLKEALADRIRSGKGFALLMADIDGFKAINDNYGHMAGDGILKSFSGEMRKIFRSTDVLGRFGGDEFFIIIDGDMSDVELEHYGDRICKAARKVRHEGIDGTVTVSVGIAGWSEEDGDSDTLFRHADYALYEAKRGGKNRCLVYRTALS